MNSSMRRFALELGLLGLSYCQMAQACPKCDDQKRREAEEAKQQAQQKHDAYRESEYEGDGEQEHHRRKVREAHAADYELDYDEHNPHYRYHDVQEEEEWDEHGDEEEDFDLIYSEWPRLLQFPEIKNWAQLHAVTDQETRQAAHVFLYFATSDNVDCFHQLDEVNEAYRKAVLSYGADSVMFFKVFGGLFAQQFNVHTFPSLVYLDDVQANSPNDSQELNLKRVVGPAVTENAINQLVMDCVENSYEQTHEESYQQWMSHLDQLNEADLEPRVLLNDMRVSMDYARDLQEQAEFAQLTGRVAASENFEQQNDLVLQVLIEQQEAVQEAISSLQTQHALTSAKFGSLSDSLAEQVTRTGQISDSTQLVVSKLGTAPDYHMMGFMGLLGLIIGFIATLFTVDSIVRHLIKKQEQQIADSATLGPGEELLETKTTPKQSTPTAAKQAID